MDVQYYVQKIIIRKFLFTVSWVEAGNQKYDKTRWFFDLNFAFLLHKFVISKINTHSMLDSICFKRQYG